MVCDFAVFFENLMEFSNETFTEFSSRYITNNVYLVGKLQMWFWKNQWDFLANGMTNSAYARVCSAFYLSSPGTVGPTSATFSPRGRWERNGRRAGPTLFKSVSSVGHVSSIDACREVVLFGKKKTFWKIRTFGKEKVIPQLFCLLGK